MLAGAAVDTAHHAGSTITLSTDDVLKWSAGILTLITGTIAWRTSSLNWKKAARDAETGSSAAPIAPSHFAISCHPRIDAADDVTLYLQTFRERTPKWAENSWEDDERDEVLPDATGGYVVPYERVRELLRHESYPFKFFLRIPVRVRTKYSERMVDADCVVTGRGEQDPEDPAFWKIWFVMPNGVIHPDIEEPWRINHCLPGR